MSVSLKITAISIPCTDCQREERNKAIQADERQQAIRTEAVNQRAALNQGVGKKIDVSL